MRPQALKIGLSSGWKRLGPDAAVGGQAYLRKLYHYFMFSARNAKTFMLGSNASVLNSNLSEISGGERVRRGGEDVSGSVC